MSAATGESASTGRVEGKERVPDAVKPPPGNPRFPLIDGLRALAVLAVVAFHAAQTWGYSGHWWGRFAAHLDVGVTIFFVLSGFLLYRPFVAARLDEAPRPRLGAYVRRRALRMLLSGLGTSLVLCTEVTFYIALPVLAACLVRLPARDRRQRVRNELIVLAVLSVGSLVFRGYVHTRQPFPASEWLPGMFDWFAIGMALAVASASLTLNSHKPKLVRLVVRLPGTCWTTAAVLFALTGALDRSA